MKKIMVVLAAMAFLIVMAGGAFAGTDSVDVSATATIINACSTGNDGVIDFGTLDAVANASGKAADAALVTTKPQIYCTAGDTYNVTAAGANGGTNEGVGYRLKNGTNFIAYSISYNETITGQGATTNIGGVALSTDLNLTPSIAAGALDNAPAGTYEDTITFTIAF